MSVKPLFAIGNDAEEDYKEAILRYLDEIESINNSEARELLKLPAKDVSYISRLFSSMVTEGILEVIPSLSTADRRYRIGFRLQTIYFRLQNTTMSALANS